MYPQSQNNAQQPDCLTTIKTWWETVPFGTKVLFLSSTVLFAIDLPFQSMIFSIFADYPILTIHGQIWRLFFTQFVNASLISFIFGLFSVYFSAIALENTIGTITFLIDLMIKNVLIQVFNSYGIIIIQKIIYIILCLLFSVLVPQILVQPSFGLWNLVMVYISIKSFSKPEEETRFLCFPVTIKNKFYPIAIIILVNIMQFPRLDFVAAAILGYIEFRFFNGMIFRPSKSTVEKLAGGLLFRNQSQRQDFIPYDGRLNPDEESSFQPRAINQPQQQQQSQATNASAFREFSGRGRILIIQYSIAVTIGSELSAVPNKVYPSQYQYPTSDETSQQTINMESQSQLQQSQYQQQQPQQQQQAKPKKNYNELGEEML